jgi:hypothetical protein
MKSEFYSYISDESCLLFEFNSISDLKIIRKIIAYSPFPDNPNLFNLALGDLLANGEVSDMSVSNNSDMEKVIATVIQTMFHFFKKHPDCLIYIIGSTAERTRLYRIIIAREITEANKYFQIYGVIESEIESFHPNRSYDSFVIGLR